MDAAAPAPSDREPAMESSLQQPLEDAVALFDALKIPYALIGGIAAMLYGRSRFTEDVDFVAAAAHEKILAAHPEIMRQHHFDPVSTWKLYHESGIEIDIWKDEFSDQIAARARTIQFHGRSMRVADVHDLIAMKLRADRPQDDYDISEIIKKTPVEEAVIQNRITAEQFSRYGDIKRRALGSG